MDSNATEEFKRIYESEFHEPIANAEAQEKGMRLLRAFSLVCETPREHQTEGPLRGSS